LRRAGRKVVWSERDGRLQPAKRRPGPIDRRGPSDGLHPRGLRPGRAAVRYDLRRGVDSFRIRLPTRANSEWDPSLGRTIEPQEAIVLPFALASRGLPLETAEVGFAHGEAHKCGYRCPKATH